MDGNGTSNGGAHEGGRGEGAVQDVAERMRRAVLEATHGTGSRTELEAAARALVADLRHRNAPPEEALLQIKQLLTDAGVRPTFPSSDRTDGDGPLSSLYRDVISWSIRYYYEGERGPGNAERE